MLVKALAVAGPGPEAGHPRPAPAGMAAAVGQPEAQGPDRRLILLRAGLRGEKVRGVQAVKVGQVPVARLPLRELPVPLQKAAVRADGKGRQMVTDGAPKVTVGCVFAQNFRRLNGIGQGVIAKLHVHGGRLAE